MLKFYKVISASVFLGLLGILPAQAATVTVEYDLTPTYVSENGVRHGYQGATIGGWFDMVGMTATAVFADGGSDVWDWVQTNPWYATLDGHSDDISMDYTHEYMRMGTTRRLESIVLDLSAASAFFDATTATEWNNQPGNSAGTGHGIVFDILDGDYSLSGAVLATYSGLIQLGTGAGTDAFTTLTIDFSNLEDGGLLSDEIRWVLDLDVFAVPGDLSPLSPVPLPAGGLLLLGALAALGATRNRRMAMA